MDEQKTTAGTGEPHAPGCFLCLNVRPFLENFWPEATRNHFRNSRIEFLKGVRSMLDDRIERLSHTEHRGTNVPVE